MAELIFFLGLLAPFALMIWLTWARRRAQRIVHEQQELDEPEFSEAAYSEMSEGADGLRYGRRFDGDDALRPPDHSGGEPDGIRSLQGRR